MNQITKIKCCLYYNCIILIIITIIITIFSSNIKYFNLGPNNDLVIISIIIDTYPKYIALLIAILFITIGEVFAQIFGLPIINFNIYNPHKKIITEFTRNQLEFYGNCMCVVTNFKHIILIFITITQIDIALFSLIISQICNFLIIKLLLKEKQFHNDLYSSNLLNNNYYPPASQEY
jgi:hypothetical protein